jgi:hypothetical protein
MAKDIGDYSVSNPPPADHPDLAKWVYGLFQESYAEKERLGWMDRAITVCSEVITGAKRSVGRTTELQSILTLPILYGQLPISQPRTRLQKLLTLTTTRMTLIRFYQSS